MIFQPPKEKPPKNPYNRKDFSNIVLNKFLRLYNHHHITPLIEFGFEQNFNSGYIYVNENLVIF